MIKNFLKDLTPPLLWRTIRQIRPDKMAWPDRRGEYGKQQPADFYNKQFKQQKKFQLHYSKTYHYPLWAVLADRLVRMKAQSILDIGCGSGQMATLLRDKSIPRYLGLDFSLAMIEHARLICPGYTFVLADVFTTDLIETHPYDTFLSSEFLEHVEDDLGILERVRPGSHVLLSVPGFPNIAHVRHFDSAAQASQRYRTYLKDMNISELIIDPSGRRFYILEGTL